MKSTIYLFSLVVGALILPCPGEEPPAFTWREQEIDTIEIGYGLQISDVDGDGKPDIVLADKRSVQWYQNPNWSKHIIAKHLTLRDNVCVTARDIDGDGKCEIAVGGGWNFPDSLKDGAVFYLKAPNDRTQPWEPIQLFNDPSTHRMHWIKGPGEAYSLMVKPLRGKGSNLEGDGPGIRIMEYFRPPNPHDPWETKVANDALQLCHNFHIVNWDEDPEEEVIVAARSGVWYLDRNGESWVATQLTTDFAGEIQDGRLPGGKRFIATVEPMHGSKSAVYTEPTTPGQPWPRQAFLAENFLDGHALAVGDFLGIGSDQVVVGWRGMNPPGVPGIRLFTPLDSEGKLWRTEILSDEKLAVEDLKAGDLDGDGKLDIVAAGRQTKNLKIFFNTVKSN